MKKATIVALSFLFALPIFGNTNKTIIISGKKAWTNTGIVVKTGDRISISSSGMVMPNGTVKSDPNGVPNRPDWQKSYSVIKTANHVCLIGKIGKHGKPFFVGKQLTFNAKSTGELYLGINDTDLGNNSGQFIAKVIAPSSSLIAVTDSEVTIPGTKPWTGTGLIFKVADKITISSSGIVMPNGTVKSDPNGVPDRPDWQKNYSVIKTANHVCLIGKIGKNGKPFFIGKQFSITSKSSGELFLGINDTDLGNNSGQFIATINSPANDLNIFNGTKKITISGTKAWTSTSKIVNSGTTIIISSSGIVMPNGTVKSGPNGVPNRPDWQKNYSVIKTANHAGLIGKIGENGKPFLVGKQLKINAKTTGELYLGINDTDLGNNSGAYQVNIIFK